LKNKILIFIRQNSLLIFLSAIAIIFYFLILNQPSLPDIVRKSLYSTGDAQEYRDFTKWLSGLSDYCNPNRPFLYPLIILLSTKLMGYLGVWYIQIGFWLSACILIYLTTFRMTGQKIFAAVSFILAASNISLLYYTIHALTEISIFFFLSVLIFLFTSIQKSKLNFIYIILVLSLLVAIKPGYQPLLYLAIVLVLIFKTKTILKNPIMMLWLLLALAPVLIQKMINKTEHGTFSNTQIADLTLRDYLFRKVKFCVENDSVKGEHLEQKFSNVPDSVRAIQSKQMAKITNTEIYVYLLKHFPVSWQVYNNNVEGNIKSGNFYIDYQKSPGLYKWVEKQNQKYYFKFHKYMFWLLLLFLVFSIRKRFSGVYLFILFGSAVSFYILLSSGISFWSGDRLVVPAIAAWASLYPVLIYFSFSLIKTKVNLFLRNTKKDKYITNR
jgi:hypothetical protein